MTGASNLSGRYQNGATSSDPADALFSRLFWIHAFGYGGRTEELGAELEEEFERADNEVQIVQAGEALTVSLFGGGGKLREIVLPECRPEGAAVAMTVVGTWAGEVAYEYEFHFHRSEDGSLTCNRETSITSGWLLRRTDRANDWCRWERADR